MAHAYTCAAPLQVHDWPLSAHWPRLAGARFSSGGPFRPVNIRGIYDDEDNSAVIVVRDGRGAGTRKPRPGERRPGSRH